MLFTTHTILRLRSHIILDDRSIMTHQWRWFLYIDKGDGLPRDTIETTE